MTNNYNQKLVNLAKKFVVTPLVVMLVIGALAPLSAANAAVPLVIYNIVTSTTDQSVTISWQTDRPSYGRVNYGLSTDNYTWTVVTSQNQQYTSQTVTIFGLNSGTRYYFRINAQTEGSEVTSLENTFVTQSGSSNNQDISTNPDILPGQSTTCGVNLKTDFGFYGLYYNLPSTHPDVEIPPQNWTKVARQNDWYNQTYYAFSRVDASLKFGNNFLPVDTGLPGDPWNFAVNWRAIIEVPQDGTYTYIMRADDDGWVFIDDQLTTNLGGIHEAKSEEKQIYLTAGYHKLEVYYAERHKYIAVMYFEGDQRLKFHPLPAECTITDVINYNNHLYGTGNGYTTGYTNGNTNGYTTQNNTFTGQVLGASTLTDNGVYVNGWDGKYSEFKAIYRTADNPSIWAITMTNQRLYITSPASFNLYGLDWSKIRTVSQATLQRYPVANLVKTPDKAAIYMLHQRAEKKWLKLLIPTGTVFVSYEKNYWGNVVTINHLDMGSYPTANLIKVKNTSKVYLISGNSKKPFASSAAFTGRNYNWADICTVTQTHADSYITGAAIN